MIVDKGADVKFAAQKAAFAGFFNSGQTCIRPDYVLIDNALANQFCEELQKALDANYGNGKTDLMGKVINDFHSERLCKLL